MIKVKSHITTTGFVTKHKEMFKENVKSDKEEFFLLANNSQLQ